MASERSVFSGPQRLRTRRSATRATIQTRSIKNGTSPWIGRYGNRRKIAGRKWNFPRPRSPSSQFIELPARTGKNEDNRVMKGIKMLYRYINIYIHGTSTMLCLEKKPVHAPIIAESCCSQDTKLYRNFPTTRPRWTLGSRSSVALFLSSVLFSFLCQRKKKLALRLFPLTTMLQAQTL